MTRTHLELSPVAVPGSGCFCEGRVGRDVAGAFGGGGRWDNAVAVSRPPGGTPRSRHGWYLDRPCLGVRASSAPRGERFRASSGSARASGSIERIGGPGARSALRRARCGTPMHSAPGRRLQATAQTARSQVDGGIAGGALPACGSGSASRVRDGLGCNPSPARFDAIIWRATGGTAERARRPAYGASTTSAQGGISEGLRV